MSDDETILLGEEKSETICRRQHLDTASDYGYELRSIKSSSARKQSDSDHQLGQYTYYDIQPGESLQGICLRYSLEISRVRQLNGLMTNQDFYGLKRLKLPVGRLGLLQERIKQQDQNQSDGQPSSLGNNNVLNQSKIKSSPGSALSIKARPDYPNFQLLLSPTVNNVFEELDYQVERVKEVASGYEKRADEILYEIDCRSDVSGVPKMATGPSKIPELFCSGENFGLNIKRLVALIIFVCLVIPLVYMNQTHII